jgi:hypothetical protein
MITACLAEPGSIHMTVESELWCCAVAATGSRRRATPSMRHRAAAASQDAN